ncbi:hypothetical protein HYDPIDRAFT_113179 [Hydnomerulius pinastri MD-312]|uniref:Uncharacterized protein n=1 Tax=Hydnomerulius pinastri MD-312 TaxID=994086 RepID=A0A0C9WEV9_9AGAM|nr:hypothetical protein HYDPIDRAFT_113179 [Hydnomerulius pinastri MD-312]
MLYLTSFPALTLPDTHHIATFHPSGNWESLPWSTYVLLSINILITTLSRTAYWGARHCYRKPRLCDTCLPTANRFLLMLSRGTFVASQKAILGYLRRTDVACKYHSMSIVL